MAKRSALPFTRLLSFSRRQGWLSQLIVGAVLVLIVGGLVLNHYLETRYSADGTAIAFVSAMGKGDTASAWSLMSVAGSPSPAGVADLATEAGLDGQLHLDPARLGVSEVSVTSHREVPGGVQVTVSSRAQHRKLTPIRLNLVRDTAANHFGLYPSWRVVAVPSVVSIKSPGVPYAVDGKMQATTTRAVRVLPGRHLVTTKQTELFGGFSDAVEVQDGQPSVVSLEPKLTPIAAGAVSAALKKSFADCFANPYGGRCPTTLLKYGGTRQLVGDPTSATSVNVNADGNAVAIGHYLGTVQQSFGSGVVSEAFGGVYKATLSLSGSTFSVDSLADSTEAPPLSRPATPTDAEILQAVQTAMTACAAKRELLPPDCPQHGALGVQTADLHWAWDSDPLAAAATSFDGQTGIFHVTGKFAATATFSQSLLGSSGTRTDHSSGSYDAEVVVDGGNVRAVTIKGAP